MNAPQCYGTRALSYLPLMELCYW